MFMRQEVRGGKKDPPHGYGYDRRNGSYRPSPRGGMPEADFAAAARRRAFRRRKHRRRVLTVFYLFLFLLVLAVAAALSMTVLFQITDVSVAGSSRYSQQEIIAASGIRKGDNLFLTKTGNVSRAIEQKLPYLGTVRVSRKFPSGIEISVREESVWGAAPCQGRYVIVGGDGSALELVKTPPQNCTALKGLTIRKAVPGQPVTYGTSGAGTVLAQVMAAVQKSGLRNITSVDFTQPSRILVRYEDRITINLGLPADLDYKFRFAKNLLQNNIKSTERGTLNMTAVSDTNKAYFDPEYGESSSGAAKK
jgi:cell division septal protein FtsQ